MFYFFDKLFPISDINRAFEMICTEKMLSDGYFDMSMYIYDRINKDDTYTQLKLHKSKYAALYLNAYADQYNAFEQWNSVIKQSGNKYPTKVKLSYEEATAIVNWVYNILKNTQDKEKFTLNLLEYIKDFHNIENDVDLKNGVVYNKAKIDLQFVSSFSEISSAISKLKIDADKTLFFRGHSNPNYILRPSVMRNSKLLSNESSLYNELQINCPEEFEKCHSHLEKLVKMQHYGLPTRLLDITKNLLVALFFACENHPESYGELVLISADPNNIKYPQSDTVSVLASLPAFSALKLGEFRSLANDSSVSNVEFNYKVGRLIHEIRLEKPAFQAEINKKDILDSFIVYALKNNKRIVKQDGAFILCGLDNSRGFLDKFRYQKKGKKIIVLITNKKKILEQLETFCINHATLFPEIECVSEYLKNKYS